MFKLFFQYATFVRDSIDFGKRRIRLAGLYGMFWQTEREGIGCAESFNSN
ncbi:MAG: hypothetical protein GX755_04225 [Syntrophomonadaceae bacterium]|nr:hypothetical protein [Syntrophomonadaceae bacterium]